MMNGIRGDENLPGYLRGLAIARRSAIPMLSVVGSGHSSSTSREALINSMNQCRVRRAHRMVRMAHPTDMSIPECHDFATHQSFPKATAAGHLVCL